MVTATVNRFFPPSATFKFFVTAKKRSIAITVKQSLYLWKNVLRIPNSRILHFFGEKLVEFLSQLSRTHGNSL